MKFVPVDIKNVNKAYRKTAIRCFLKEFLASNIACARIEDTKYAHTNNAAISLNASIKRYGLTKLKVIIRDGIPYIVNTELIGNIKF